MEAGMEFSLTPEQLTKLTELAFLGEWMINAHHDNEAQDEEATKVLQQLLALHVGKGVGRDEETKQYYIESEWSNRLFDRYVLDYDDHTFWEELTERLAQRDLAEQRGVKLEEISREEDIQQLRPLEERYRQEFEDHGIESLEIVGE